MMPEKTVLILEREGGPWQKFLSDYFSDTPAVVRSVSEPAQAAIFFDRAFPKVVFAEPSFLNRSFLQL